MSEENRDADDVSANIIEPDERQRERMPEPPASSDHPGVSAGAPDHSAQGLTSFGTHAGADPGANQPANERANGSTHKPTDARADEPGYWTEPLAQPPESVRKRYLHAGHQYFLKDEPHRLAFVDQGPRIVTEHNRPDIAESMVEMAQAKGWDRIRVSGHLDFQREAWLQASLRGIAVTGYAPQAVDRARLAELREHRMTNRVELAPERSAADPASGAVATPGRGGARTAERRAPVEAPTAANTPAPANTWNGALIEHGGARYQHNPGNSRSYFVTYRDASGSDHTVWGVDLERAMSESGARVGDAIALENLGRRLVTIEEPVRDAAGTIVGVEEKDVYRNTWQVDVIGRDKASDVPAQSNRAQSVPEVSVSHGSMPQRPVPRDRATVEPLPAGRQRAQHDHDRSRATDASSPTDRSPPDQAVHLAVIVEAMRAQGFSAKSVAKVQARTARMLETFREMGAQVPAPRVYDVKAPSQRGRDRTQSDEVTRTQDRAQEKASEKTRRRSPSEPSLPGL